jgi:hypothetical protein
MVGQHKMRFYETWDWGIEWIHLGSELRKWVSSFEKVISPQFQKMQENYCMGEFSN